MGRDLALRSIQQPIRMTRCYTQTLEKGEDLAIVYLRQVIVPLFFQRGFFMAVEAFRAQPYHLNGQDVRINPRLIKFSSINLGTNSFANTEYPHIETSDFPQDDPWSLHMTSVITMLREKGAFAGKDVTELGVGDARNLIRAGRDVTRFTGVDIDPWRLGIGLGNLKNNPLTENIPAEGWDADAISVLEAWTQQERRISGYVFACLPQSPEGQNAADAYQADDPLYKEFTRWNSVGLTLNAAALQRLRPLVDQDNTHVLLMLSDRVPAKTRETMIGETGWHIAAEYPTNYPIQQDPDTGIAWVQQIDDGNRFYEYTPQGIYTPISAHIAEERRKASTGRENLNVFHHLSVYDLTPRPTGGPLFDGK